MGLSHWTSGLLGDGVLGGWVVGWLGGVSLSPPQTSKGKGRSGGKARWDRDCDGDWDWDWGIAQQVCLINAL